MGEAGQPTSCAKAAACCCARSGLMTAAGESAEPPWGESRHEVEGLHPSLHVEARTLPGGATGIREVRTDPYAIHMLCGPERMSPPPQFPHWEVSTLDGVALRLCYQLRLHMEAKR